jgi:hypothetical protein
MTLPCQLLGDCNLRFAGLKGLPAPQWTYARNALDPRGSSGVSLRSAARNGLFGMVLNTQNY